MSLEKKKVGLFGGTFDPIHFGHLNIAITLMEVHKLDEIIFCPAAISPFKGATPPKASKEDRKKMVKLAIQQVPAFSLLSTELDRVGLSYTIDTIKDVLAKFHEKKKDVELNLILGEDSLSHFHLWKDVEEVINLAPPLIASRATEQLPQFNLLSPLIQDVIRMGATKTPRMDISGTAIRKRISQNKFCGHLVPAPVLEYIYTHQLYLEKS